MKANQGALAARAVSWRDDALGVVASLERLGVKYALCGTGGLAARGYEVPVPDVDFVVDRFVSAEEVGLTPAHTGKASGQSVCGRATSGTKVDLIFYQEPVGAKHGARIMGRAEMIGGVMTASVFDIIALKKFAGRKKDLSFLEAWAIRADRQPRRAT